MARTTIRIFSTRPSKRLSWKKWSLAAALLPLAAVAAQPDAAPPAGERLCAAYRGLPQGFDAARAGHPNRAGMVPIRGGRFRMGSEEGYPEERQVHSVRLDGFLIDRHEVTNAQFAAFVKATGHVTVAERKPSPGDAANITGNQLPAGGVIFVWPKNGEQFKAAYQWWQYKSGANWRHPYGPGSSIAGLENHPVVQIAYDDAVAYAKWLGRDLPTEAEAEYAARGGLDGATYPWGNTPDVNGRSMANAWQGAFPNINTGQDGHRGTAPVGCYPPNGYGVFDAVGNVWEWTKDVYVDRHPKQDMENPMIVRVANPRDAGPHPDRIIKGGSFLCSPDFCLRYRPSSRQPQDPTLSTVHIGFRTVLRLNAKDLLAAAVHKSE